MSSHDASAQRAVPHHERGVDRDGAVETSQPFTERLPPPLDALLESHEWHALHHRHHAADVVGVVGAGERREGEAAE